MLKVLIEKEDDQQGVSVTTDDESMTVEQVIMLLELAKLSVFSYYLGGADNMTANEDEVSL